MLDVGLETLKSLKKQEKILAIKNEKKERERLRRNCDQEYWTKIKNAVNNMSSEDFKEFLKSLMDKELNDVIDVIENG